MNRPLAVARSTSPMLLASARGSLIPLPPRTVNAFIMPMTVPSRPIIGETTPITER